MKSFFKYLKNIRRNFFEFITDNPLDFFPIRKTVKEYKSHELKKDFKAGINVALLAFPQGMAYAAIAGLPIYYGIFGSAVAAIVGPLFSKSRFIILGPTNATSVLLFTSFLAMNVTESEKLFMLPFLIFLVGIFLVIGSFLKVANLIQYVSRSVVTGYITAAAFYIILNQLRKSLGIEFDLPEKTTFYTIIKLTLLNLTSLHIPSIILSLITVLLYMTINKNYKTLPNVAITLVCMSFITIGLNYILETYPSLNGESIRMLSAFSASDWHMVIPTIYHGWIRELSNIALVIAFLSILEGSSIGKSLAARSGERIDTNQEMMSMGMANIGCGFLGGMPASGSLTRSQLSWSSGAATPIASLISGFVCLAGAFTLGPFIKFIPLPVLAVVVIGIGISLINIHAIKIVTKTTQSDAIVFITTFISALLVSLDFAVILGTATSILLFLRKAASPELVEYSFTDEGELTALKSKQRPDPEISIVHVEGDLFFGATELFRDQMRRVVEDPNLKVVILKMRNAYHLDATSVFALEELIHYARENNRHLLISEARKNVIRVFKNSGLMEIIGRENIFPDVTQNPTKSTARALKRTQEILGDQQPKVSIYAKEK